MPLLGRGVAPRVPECRAEADPLRGHQGPGLLADRQLVLQHLPPGRGGDRLSVRPPLPPDSRRCRRGGSSGRTGRAAAP
eukprot:5943167-Lingulodinium_polyedra.AAC.1